MNAAASFKNRWSRSLRVRMWFSYLALDLPFVPTVPVAFIAMNDLWNSPELWILLRWFALVYVVKTVFWSVLLAVMLRPVDDWLAAVDNEQPVDDSLIQRAAVAADTFPMRFLLPWSFIWGIQYVVIFIDRDSLPVATEYPSLLVLFCLTVAVAAGVFNVPFNIVLLSKVNGQLSLALRQRRLVSPVQGGSFRARLVALTVGIAAAATGWMVSAGYTTELRTNAEDLQKAGYFVRKELVDQVLRRSVAAGLQGEDIVRIVEQARSVLTNEAEKASDGEPPRVHPFALVRGDVIADEATAARLRIVPEMLIVGDAEEWRSAHDPRTHLAVSVERVVPDVIVGAVVDVNPQASRLYVFGVVFFFIVVMIFTPMVAILIGMAVGGPVAGIGQLLKQIIERGDFEHVERVPVYRYDELGSLAARANDMIDKLEQAFAQNKDQLSELAEKNRQLESTTNELEDKNEALIAAARMKSQFLASMSHELRTPLNAIIGFSRMVMKKTEGQIPEQQTRNLKLINESGQALLALVNDLLDFERIEAGRLNLVEAEVDCVELGQSLRDTLRPIAEKKGMTLDVQVHGALKLRTDPDRLRQILINFINNSIKYSNSGHVDVQILQGGDGQVRFVVRDQGIGIPPDQLQKIFEPFHQVDGSFSREREGVGLGLAIVRRLVDLLGGTIEVSSEMGQGSVFTLVMPGRCVIPFVDPETLKPIGAGPVVLAIDDDRKVLEVIRQELADRGFRVHCLDSPERALHVADELKPDVIILDIQMPQKSGWQVLRELRRVPATHGIPVIICSVLDEDRSRGEELGISGWLTKPFEPGAFAAALERVQAAPAGDALIVEDDPATLALVEQQVEALGFRVRRARTATDAEAAFADRLPDVMVLDLTLPGGDGRALLAELRRRPGGARPRVVVYTARDLQESEQRDLDDLVAVVVKKHGEDGVDDVIAALRSRLRRSEPPAQR